MLPNNYIKRQQNYYKFVTTEQPEELNGISQQKGKFIKLSQTDKKPQATTYKFYIED